MSEMASGRGREAGTARSSRVAKAEESGRSLLAGILIGIGVAGFIDETIFHQLLHWHHFYDKSTPTVGLVSDGLFHAFSWVCIVGGLFLFADIRRRRTYWHLRFLAGFCFGLGGFQLYDGTIQHKLLGLHQIRYHVSILPYDVVWDGLAAIVLVVGIVLYRRSTQPRPVTQTVAGPPK
jgi:uncharacterized membrane protein